MECYSFVLSKTTQNIINDSRNLEVIFDFSNLDKNHEICNNKNKRVVGKFKIEGPINNWKDEFIALRSKGYSFKCNNKNTNILRCFSKYQSKNIKFEEYYFCLFGQEYQKQCDNYIFCARNCEMYLQRVQKSILFPFDEKRCFKKQ